MSKILIVEDEIAIAELEKDYLELSGFEVEVENSGDVGLVRALKEEFDLVILDLMLPASVCNKPSNLKSFNCPFTNPLKSMVPILSRIGTGFPTKLLIKYGIPVRLTCNLDNWPWRYMLSGLFQSLTDILADKSKCFLSVR